MRPRLIRTVCIATLLAAFAVDLLTPQLFVAAILLDVPIVLSSLGTSRRFTYWLIAVALAADALAGYVNGVQDHYRWDALGIGDRVLAGLSIALAGYLSTAVQEAGQRAGRLEAAQTRAARERNLADAMQRVRGNLTEEVVRTSIVREALALFDATAALFVTVSEAPLVLRARRDLPEVDETSERQAPEVLSLVARTLDGGDVMAVGSDDAFGRLVLDRLDAGALLALPIADRERRFGALLVTFERDGATEATALARPFATQAGLALAQARLFTELAERNQQLEGRNAVIRDLVFALSHDLRTPLAALGMTLRQASAGAYGAMPERYAPILSRSIVATDDLQRLAETLLLVARFESGDRLPERNVVAMDALVEQIAGEFQASAATREVTLRTEIQADTRVVGDRGDLRRAVTNLVANALENTPAGGTVRVAVAQAGGSATIAVSDDGPGVPPALRARLFTAFAQSDERRGRGTGLGLYIVRRVAEESGGSVNYAPREPNGSSFTLSLPSAKR